MVLLAACSSPKPIATHNSARPYLKLIEPNNEWRLPIAVTTGHFTDRFVTEQHTTGTVHCETDKLDRIGEAAVSHLRCDKPYDDLSISGTWVAQSYGLYHPLGPITEPDDLASLVDDDLLINDPPRERDHSHTGDVATRTVGAAPLDSAGWCVADKTIENGVARNELGDKRSFTLCFNAATGIIAAAELDVVKADKSWREVRLGSNAPFDADDPLGQPHEDD